jgi:hypothetical protein
MPVKEWLIIYHDDYMLPPPVRTAADRLNEDVLWSNAEEIGVPWFDTWNQVSHPYDEAFTP